MHMPNDTDAQTKLYGNKNTNNNNHKNSNNSKKNKLSNDICHTITIGNACM